MRSGDETGSTIEFELKPDELLGASRLHAPDSAGAGRASSLPTAAAVPNEASRARPVRRWAAVLAIGVAGGAFLCAISGRQLSGPVAKRPQNASHALARETAALEVPRTPSSKPLPLWFANPFDATEVFEFPPGTSREYAREAVAEILLNRARDRHARHAQRSRIRRVVRNF